MARYIPTTIVNRRKRLIADARPEIVRVTMLGIFTILLGFFVALVANTKPSEKKTINLLATLQSTFKPLTATQNEMVPIVDVPDWMAGNPSATGGTSPMNSLRKLYPEAFAKSQNNWGSIELYFTADRFQSLLLTEPTLAQSLFSGFAAPRAKVDDYIVSATIGTKEKTSTLARALFLKTEQNLVGLGVHPSRLLVGYEAGGTGITLRITPANRFVGAL